MIESDWKVELFDYRDEKGRNDVKRWMLEQEKRQRAQVNLKLDMLRKYGNDVGSNVLLRMSATIFKLKGKTKGVQLRPMLCKGPVDDDREFTILIGATEIDWKLVPADAVVRAERRRDEIIRDPKGRRQKHERVD
ncbi:MAG: hypothetical protein QOK37_422 [Thermoanaerobaculia bacterium]|jgi:hypothetical protein|nr:hypothetical protein [Thermoanaerobaculia bacterium]